MHTFISLIQEHISERWEQNVYEIIVRELVKYGCVLGRFVQISWDYIREEIFNQEPAIYRSGLQRILGIVAFEAGKIFQKAWHWSSEVGEIVNSGRWQMLCSCFEYMRRRMR